jgi:hypothetical protein
VDTTSWLVAFSDPRSCHVLRWRVPLDKDAISLDAYHGGGQVYDYVDREVHTGHHHDTICGFRIVPVGGEGGGPIHIETEISLPDTAHPAIFNGQTIRIVYLTDGKRVLKNEAVDIEILSGIHAGFHDSLDARPAGAWLAIPVGAAFLGFGLAGLRSMKEDAIAAASDDGDSST